MLKIAVIGHFKETKCALKSVLKNKNLNILNINQNFNKENTNCDILIISKPLKSKIINLPNKCIILLNIDNVKKDNIKIYSPNIITYGTNSKSIITFSSIEKFQKTKIQFCVQNSIKSFSGNIIYEQEFPVYYNSQNLYVVLSSVTVALLNDVIF